MSVLSDQATAAVRRTRLAIGLRMQILIAVALFGVVIVGCGGTDTPSGSTNRTAMGDGDLYVADYSANVVYRVTPLGERRRFVAGLQTPTGISFDRDGDLLVANRASDEIVRVSPSGAARVVANGLRTPVGVAQDSTGALLVSNYGGGVSRIAPNGDVTPGPRQSAGLSGWRWSGEWAGVNEDRHGFLASMWVSRPVTLRKTVPACSSLPFLLLPSG
jgi:hypothetical protein